MGMDIPGQDGPPVSHGNGRGKAFAPRCGAAVQQTQAAFLRKPGAQNA